MNTKANDLTAAALEGYSSNKINRYIYSSPNFYACALGDYFRITGRPAPRDVRMGRGDSIRASDMRFTFTGSKAAGIMFERVE